MGSTFDLSLLNNRNIDEAYVKLIMRILELMKHGFKCYSIRERKVTCDTGNERMLICQGKGALIKTDMYYFTKISTGFETFIWLNDILIFEDEKFMNILNGTDDCCTYPTNANIIENN